VPLHSVDVEFEQYFLLQSPAAPHCWLVIAHVPVIHAPALVQARVGAPLHRKLADIEQSPSLSHWVPPPWLQVPLHFTGQALAGVHSALQRAFVWSQKEP
jgi:hypothetical protein